MLGSSYSRLAVGIYTVFAVLLFQSAVFAKTTSRVPEKTQLNRYMYDKGSLESLFNRQLEKQTLPIEKIAAIYLSKESLETARVLMKYPAVFKVKGVFSIDEGKYVSNGEPYVPDARFESMIEDSLKQEFFIPKLFIEFEVDANEFRKIQNDKIFQKEIIQDQGTATMEGNDVVYYPYVHIYTSKVMIPIYDSEPLKYFGDEAEYQGFAFDEQDAFLFVLARRDGSRKDKVITIKEKSQTASSGGNGTSVLVDQKANTNGGMTRSQFALKGSERHHTFDVNNDTIVSHVLALLMEAQGLKFLKYPYLKGDPLWPTTLRHIKTGLQTRIGEFKKPGRKEKIQALPVRNVIFMDRDTMDAYFNGFWEFMYVHQRERDFYKFAEGSGARNRILANERKYASYEGNFSCINALNIVQMPVYYQFDPSKPYSTSDQLTKEIEKLNLFVDLYYQYRSQDTLSIEQIVNADSRVRQEERSKYIQDLNSFIESLELIKTTAASCYAPDEKK